MGVAVCWGLGVCRSVLKLFLGVCPLDLPSIPWPSDWENPVTPQTATQFRVKSKPYKPSTLNCNLVSPKPLTPSP